MWSESTGSVYGIDDAFQSGNKYFYPVQKHNTAVEMFQTLVEQNLVTLGYKIEKTPIFFMII